MPSGRVLCEDCFASMARLAGAGAALASGVSAANAVASGVAAGGHASAVRANLEYQQRHAAKLASTHGFWKRLWVRAVG